MKTAIAQFARILTGRNIGGLTFYGDLYSLLIQRSNLGIPVGGTIQPAMDSKEYLFSFPPGTPVAIIALLTKWDFKGSTGPISSVTNSRGTQCDVYRGFDKALTIAASTSAGSVAALLHC